MPSTAVLTAVRQILRDTPKQGGVTPQNSRPPDDAENLPPMLQEPYVVTSRELIISFLRMWLQF